MTMARNLVISTSLCWFRQRTHQRHRSLTTRRTAFTVESIRPFSRPFRDPRKVPWARSAGAARPCRGRPLSQPRDVPRNLRSVAALQRWNGRVRQGGSVRVRQFESSDVSKRSSQTGSAGPCLFWPTHRLSLCARPSDQRVIGPCELRTDQRLSLDGQRARMQSLNSSNGGTGACDFLHWLS